MTRRADADERTAQRRTRDDQIAAEPERAPPDLPPGAVPTPMETSKSGRPRFKTIMTGLTDASQALRGKDIFYRCEICKEYVSSQPTDNTKCTCGNIVIDAEYIRLLVKDFSKFLVASRRP